MVRPCNGLVLIDKRLPYSSDNANDQNYELLLPRRSKVELSRRMVMPKATGRASPAVPADLKGALLLRCARASNFAKSGIEDSALSETRSG